MVQIAPPIGKNPKRRRFEDLDGLVTPNIALKNLCLLWGLCQNPLDKALTGNILLGVMDKYDKMRKLERNRMLFQYIDDHPELTFEEVGRVFNISRQRVSQLLKIERLKNK